jgi:hypothetical protein
VVYGQAVRVLAGALALAALLSLQASAGAAPSQLAPEGEQRIAVVLATWGPRPVTVEEARAAIAETGAFVRAASFGRTSLDVDLIGWVEALPARPVGCDTSEIHSTIQRSVDLSGYDLGAYVLPRIDCPWTGAYPPPGVWMLGEISMKLFAHELGHNYGIREEGPAWRCAGGRCRAETYESPYSVMGHGTGHFSAYEKFKAGWIEHTGVPARSGEFEIARIDRPSSLPHALYVVTANDEHWIEYRPEVDWPVVYAGPSGLPGARSRYPARNLLLEAARSRTFSVPGAFSVELVGADGERATLRFRWTDRTRPSRPRVRTSVRGRRVALRFAANDVGSGVERFELRVDGRVRGSVRTTEVVRREVLTRETALTLTLGLGAHRIVATAVDRAGNRSRGAVQRLRIG